MLIERMKTNPEDFTYKGKLYRALDSELLSVRDLKAYNDAHDLYIKEPNLMATVLQALLVQPEEEGVKAAANKIYGKQFVGISDTQLESLSTKTWFDEATQTVRRKSITPQEMFEDHIQTHKEALKKQSPAMHTAKESIAAQIYNKAFGRERIERDN